jgi:hypothetical protein
LKNEFALALLPTATALLVLAFVEAFSRQRLLFASLASSAFLIYLDPEHAANSARTLVLAQTSAAAIGFLAFRLFGPGYYAAGGSMIAIIVGMILFDAVHPPAVATALSFAFRAGPESNLYLFALAVGMVILLLGLERVTLWLLTRFSED